MTTERESAALDAAGVSECAAITVGAGSGGVQLAQRISAR